MSSGITFSGFNSIDFNSVLNAIMQQESEPLQALQTRQTALQGRVTNFSTLSTRVTALQSAATALTSNTTSYKASSSDSAAVAISSGTSAVPGRYDVVVNELARAQVTASQNASADADTTTVATGGSITIGGTTITISAATTLKGLSDQINATADAPVRASVVQSGAAAFKLVLTAKNTGEANGFTVTDNLSGGAFDLQFTDTDHDGIAGNSVEDNAVQATDAQLSINNIDIKSASNTLDAAIPGSTVTLLKKNPGVPVTIEVSEDQSALKTRLQSFINGYNDLVKFVSDQGTSKLDSAIGKEPVVRNLRNTLRASLSQEYATGGAFNYLSQIGLEITQAGTMQLNESVFNDAVKNGTADIATLLTGTDATPGALASIGDALKQYTQAQGLLQMMQSQLNDQIARLGTQVSNMQDRLAVRRTSLQQEFTAADAAMTRLKSQSGSIQGVSL